MVDIFNWRRIDDRITTSGQPSEAQFAALVPLGVRTVINLGLHTHERALSDEAGILGALGLTYIHIPVAFDAPTEDDFAAFCDAMAASANVPVHIHCIMNMRVSAFLYRYNRDVIGLEADSMRTIMHSIWQPGGVWAAFINDADSVALPHRGPTDKVEATPHPSPSPRAKSR